MRKRYLQDYAMFAESDNFVAEVSMDDNPFTEGAATSAEGAEDDEDGEGDEDVDVES